ncbi:MAG: hypothetical protein ACJ8BF_04265 [Gemmatimonadales bacterium]
MARNACGLALLIALALSGCSTFSHKKEELAAKAAEAKLAVLRMRTDSLRKARRLADSLAQARQVACVDSVRIELSKVASAKLKGKRKKRQVQVSEENILAKAGTVCTEMALPAATVATAAPSSPPPPADSVKRTAHDSVKSPVAAAPAGPPAGSSTPAGATVTPDSIAWADSVRKAKEIEMSRETFSYGGAARDPFNSLLNMAKSGPELADLQLVGIYQNLRRPEGSVAVFREKEGGKRHKLHAGDQVGRSRLVQIRDRDVVFMIEDFGFERQETLSLRKQEDVLQ